MNTRSNNKKRLGDGRGNLTWNVNYGRADTRNIRNSYKAFSFIPDPKTNFGI